MVRLLWLHFMLVAIILISGCQKRGEEFISRALIDQQGELVYQMDTLKIPIDENTSYTYFRFNTYEEMGRFYFVTYKSGAHTLNFYDIANKKLSRTIKMEKGGPNGISEVQNFYIHNLDSIFVFDMGNMKIMDEDAEVFYRMNLFASAPQGLLIDFANVEAKPFYNSNVKKVILKNGLRRNASVEEKGKPILAAIDLETKAFELIGPQHADFMKNAKAGYGTYHGVHYTQTDSTILYNYPVSSTIYSFNLLTKESREQNGSVTSIPDQAVEFKNAPTQAFIDEYRYQTPIFYNLLYDPDRQLYYRLHRTGKPFDPAVRNTLLNTTFYVSVFNREMEFIKEVKVGKNIYSQFTAFVAPEGLFLNASFKDFPLLEESNMIFHVFDFSFK